MGVTAALRPSVYGKLLARALPKVIASTREFDRMVALLEDLEIPERNLTPEESALRDLLTKLINDYDDAHYPLPELEPHQMLRFLLDQRGLRQADLVPVMGSRTQVSDAVTGRRGISKAQAKRLATFFGVTPDLFI